MAIDISKQQTLNTNPKSKQQINVTGNLSGNNNRRLIFFIIEEVKERVLDFSQGTVNVKEL